MISRACIPLLSGFNEHFSGVNAGTMFGDGVGMYMCMCMYTWTWAWAPALSWCAVLVTLAHVLCEVDLQEGVGRPVGQWWGGGGVTHGFRSLAARAP